MTYIHVTITQDSKITVLKWTGGDNAKLLLVVKAVLCLLLQAKLSLGWTRSDSIGMVPKMLTYDPPCLTTG